MTSVRRKFYPLDKVFSQLKDRKKRLEGDMIMYQDEIERMREKDFKEYEELKEHLKNLRGDSEDMDYELIRLSKKTHNKRLIREIEDMEINIDGMKN